MESVKRLFRFIATAAIVIIVGTLINGQPVEANTPLTIVLTFETPTTVSLGEPIIGHYTITNTSDHDQMCLVGPQTNGCLTPSDMVSGKVVSTSQGPRIYAEASDQVIRVSAKDSNSGIHTGRFVINGWHEPGSHSLSLTLHFTYSAAQDNASADNGEHHNNSVFNQVFNTDVTVLPTNVRHVRDTSEALRRSILNEKDSNRRHLLIMALFSMPGTFVHDCWARLVSDSQTSELDQSYITQQLSLVPSLEAADIFAYQIWNMKDSVLTMPGTPKYELANLYDHSDATVRQHIRDLYAQHGVQIADKIELPTTGD